jgi:hypothetical protein
LLKKTIKFFIKKKKPQVFGKEGGRKGGRSKRKERRKR